VAGTQEPPDSELLAALLLGGDIRRRAWNDLVARHSPALYAVARSFRVNAQTAEDLVQIAWLRLLERAGQLRDPDALGPWLCTIVRNEARRIVTRQRETPTILQLDHIAADGRVEERLIAGEQGRALRVAFAALGPDCRQLLQLFLADPPLSYDQIAAAVGRPRGSLGPSRRRCLDQLRNLLPAGFVR
jgi:RNA polymerase sigma factor (sigma-70 family)